MTGPAPRRPQRSDAVLRAATSADAAALVELRAVMFEVMGVTPEELADPHWRRGASDWFAERVTADGVHVVVADVDGLVVSSAVGEVTALTPGPNAPNGSVGLLSNVATRHPWRGLGLAAACTDALLRWFVEDTDVTRVDLFATSAGAPIYAARGFTTRAFPAMCLPVPRPTARPARRE